MLNGAGGIREKEHNTERHGEKVITNIVCFSVEDMLILEEKLVVISLNKNGMQFLKGKKVDVMIATRKSNFILTILYL
jgi:hypothetical protein